MEQITAKPPGEPQVVCGAVAAECICDEPPKHEGAPHVCKCQGSWFGVIDTPGFAVVRYPVAVPGNLP